MNKVTDKMLDAALDAEIDVGLVMPREAMRAALQAALNSATSVPVSDEELVSCWQIRSAAFASQALHGVAAELMQCARQLKNRRI
jgi:hypothetical protein